MKKLIGIQKETFQAIYLKNSLEQTAALLGVSVGTIRNYARSINLTKGCGRTLGALGKKTLEKMQIKQQQRGTDDERGMMVLKVNQLASNLRSFAQRHKSSQFSQAKEIYDALITDAKIIAHLAFEIKTATVDRLAEIKKIIDDEEVLLKVEKEQFLLMEAMKKSVNYSKIEH